MNNDSKLIDRLKKLLALAGNNPSQSEAEAAMAKAQAIAVENGINLAMIGEIENETEVVREDMEFGQRLPTVNTYVSNLLIKFFNVRIITSGSRYGGRKLIFVGKQEDINTAKYVYTWLSETMIRCWHNYRKANKYTVDVGHKQSYLLGFYNGLSNKLAVNQKDIEKDKLKTVEQQNKYAVSVVNLQKKIQDFMDEEFPRLRTGASRSISMNQSSYARGIMDGSTCNIAKGGIGNRSVAQLTY